MQKMLLEDWMEEQFVAEEFVLRCQMASVAKVAVLEVQCHDAVGHSILKTGATSVGSEATMHEIATDTVLVAVDAVGHTHVVVHVQDQDHIAEADHEAVAQEQGQGLAVARRHQGHVLALAALVAPGHRDHEAAVGAGHEILLIAMGMLTLMNGINCFNTQLGPSGDSWEASRQLGTFRIYF